MSVAFADCLASLNLRFGKSRQAFHQKRVFLDQRIAQSMLVLDLVIAIRREIRRIRHKKAVSFTTGTFAKSGIHMGRDRLHELLRTHHLLIRHRRLVPKTTHSNHPLRKYPNLIEGLSIIETEQVWVCDMDCHEHEHRVHLYLCWLLLTSILKHRRMSESFTNGPYQSLQEGE